MFAWMTKPMSKSPSSPRAGPMSPAFTPTTIRCLRIPADGSKPHFIQRETIYINSDKLPDCFLYHIPDVRVFWTAPEPGKSIWGARTLRRVDVSEQPNGNVNGYYYFFRCCHEHLPRNPYFPRASGVKGDVFLVKVGSTSGWLEPAPYVDVPTDFLEDNSARMSLRLMMNAYVYYKADQR